MAALPRVETPRPQQAPKSKKPRTPKKPVDVVALPSALGGGEAYRARPLDIDPVDEVVSALRKVLRDWFGDATDEFVITHSLEGLAEPNPVYDFGTLVLPGENLPEVMVAFRGFRCRGKIDVKAPGGARPDSPILQAIAEANRTGRKMHGVDLYVRTGADGPIVEPKVERVNAGDEQTVTDRAAFFRWAQGYSRRPDGPEALIAALRQILATWFGDTDGVAEIEHDLQEAGAYRPGMDFCAQVRVDGREVFHHVSFVGFRASGDVTAYITEEMAARAEGLRRVEAENLATGKHHQFFVEVILDAGEVKVAAKPEAMAEETLEFFGLTDTPPLNVATLPPSLGGGEGDRPAPQSWNGRDPQTTIEKGIRPISPLPREVALLLAQFGAMSIGTVVRTLRATQRAGQLSELETQSLIAQVVEDYADCAALVSPECLAVDEVCDRWAQALGVENFLKVEVDDLSPEDRTIYDRFLCSWGEARNLYVARLLEECGEDDLAQTIRTAFDTYEAVFADGADGLAATEFNVVDRGRGAVLVRGKQDWSGAVGS